MTCSIIIFRLDEGISSEVRTDCNPPCKRRLLSAGKCNSPCPI
jgi:hypothetical protein